MGNEKSVGFFNQFAYAIRGIVRPKYFNRMAKQKVFNLIVFVIILSLLSTGIYWGYQYLKFMNSNGIREFIEMFPEFTYSNGKLNIPEEFTYDDTNNNKVYFAFTDIKDAYNCDLGSIKTSMGWGDGREMYALTENAIIGFDKDTGKESYYSYEKIAKIFSTFFVFPETFSKGDLKGIIASNTWRMIALVAAVAFLVNVFYSFTIVPLILAAIGFGLNKLLHGDYSFKELYFVSIYIYCMVALMKTPFKLLPIAGSVLMWLGFAGMLAYLYFALTGSRTEIVNASSIDLGKKEPQFNDDLGFTGGGRSSSKPFEKRKMAASYQTPQEKPLTPSYTKEVSPSPSVIVAEVPTPSVPVYEEPVYNEPAYTQTTYAEPAYEESVYTEPAYEEPVYTEPAYEEPVYEETSAYYEEPEPVAEASQSDLVFGNMSGGFNTVGSTGSTGSINKISGIGGGLGGSTYSNSGGSYAGGGGNYVSRNTSSHIGGYHDPAYDMPQNDSLSGSYNEPLPKLNSSYGGTFSVNDLGSSLLGSSTFAAAGQSTFGGSTYGSNFGGSSSYGSSYGGNSFGRAKDEPLLRSTGSGSQADKDFEEWERQHYGNK